MSQYGNSADYRNCSSGSSGITNGDSSSIANSVVIRNNNYSNGSVVIPSLYSPNIQCLLWDPSSLSYCSPLPMVTGENLSQKRNISDSLLPLPNKRSHISDTIYEALQQTVVPGIPQTSNSTALQEQSSNVDQNEEQESSHPMIPALNYFSNGILYLNNGNIQSVELATSHLAPIPIYDNYAANISLDSDDSTSDCDVIYSDQEEEPQSVQRKDVVCETLKDYSCPICYESPVCPVSTICGHVFCEKCIQRLFRMKCSKWRCPQCRQMLRKCDYHAIYLP